MPRKPRVTSEKKSEVALKKKRVNGRFVAADPEALQRKKEELERNRIALEGFQDQDRISEEDREKFGDDAYEFLKVALSKAPTWYEGLKYAKELLSRQKPALSSIETKGDLTVTRVLRWSWEDDPSAKLIEQEETLSLDDRTADNSTVQAEQGSDVPTPESTPI